MRHRPDVCGLELAMKVRLSDSVSHTFRPPRMLFAGIAITTLGFAAYLFVCAWNGIPCDFWRATEPLELDSPMAWALISLLVACGAYLLWAGSTRITLDPNGLHVYRWPFPVRTVAWNDVLGCERRGGRLVIVTVHGELVIPAVIAQMDELIRAVREVNTNRDVAKNVAT